MFTLPIIAGFATLTIWLTIRDTTEKELDQLPAKLSGRLDKMWQIVQSSIKENKYLRAEKALLTILRVDERNATAYNRLGILYAKQRAYNDAIECFEIAQSLQPDASSLHNVGLIYYETEQYEKAAIAFEQAIEMESELAARYIAYAKVQEKLGDHKKMVSALEKAVEIEPNPQSLKVLAEAYERVGEKELADAINDKVKKIIVPPSTPKTIRQPRKVVM